MAGIIQGARLYDELAADDEVLRQTGKSIGGPGILGELTQGVDEQAMSATFVIVTNPRGAKQNRNGNVVRITESKEGRGLQLQDYVRNPVVLLDHGFNVSVPVALSMPDKDGGPETNTTRLQVTKATSSAFFSQSIPESESTFALIAEGFLRMASIGFRAHKAIRLMQQEERRQRDDGIRDFEAANRYWEIVESELLEWSVTGIGADRGSLRQTLDRGSINDVRIAGPVKLFLQQHAEPVTHHGIGLPDDLTKRLTQSHQTFGEELIEGLEGLLDSLTETQSVSTDEEPDEQQNAAEASAEDADDSETQSASTDDTEQPEAEQSADTDEPLPEMPVDHQTTVAEPLVRDGNLPPGLDADQAQAIVEQIRQSVAAPAPAPEPEPAEFQQSIVEAVTVRIDQTLAPVAERIESLEDRFRYLTGQ